MTFENIRGPRGGFKSITNIDEKIFYSVPTSFFVTDNRIPSSLRELITEAEGCSKMNYLTGASACTRKAIYELLRLQKCKGDDYNKKIKSLKKNFKNIDSTLFDILNHIKDMTSDHVHEQSWVAWSSNHLKLFIETLKTILHEIYVLPAEKKSRVTAVKDSKEQLEVSKKSKKKKKIVKKKKANKTNLQTA